MVERITHHFAWAGIIHFPGATWNLMNLFSLPIAWIFSRQFKEIFFPKINESLVFMTVSLPIVINPMNRFVRCHMRIAYENKLEKSLSIYYVFT